MLSIGLLATLLFKLTKVPGGMFLSGLFLGLMLLVLIIIGCLILTAILKLIFKRIHFLTILSILTSISFLIFHYQLYSPTLKIKVPNSYTGEANLVLYNVEENILTVDSNGIGYINDWTFEEAYTRPIVEQMDGKNLDNRLVGFNPSSFWCVTVGGENSIRSKSFEIVPDDTTTQKPFDSKDWRSFINKRLVLLKNPNKGIESYETTVEIE